MTMSATTEWSGDGRPAWVPAWIPSVQSLKTAFISMLPNMKGNLMREGKDKKEAAIECTVLLLEAVSFVLMLIGFVPGIPPWGIAQILGICLMVFGALFFVMATATLGTRLTFLPTMNHRELENPGYLITVGAYEHCRHPLYTGVISFCVGYSMLTLWTGALFWTLVLTITLEFKADLEELHLTERFQDYSLYASKTPKFFPYLGKLVGGNEEGYHDVENDRVAE